LARSEQSRSIDIGYRAWGHPPWLGRYGFLKTQIAKCFQKKAPQFGLITDLSVHPKDTLLGDDWYKFLLRCKYTLGVESGAGILDRDGSIRRKTNEYLLDHPKANFEEVEAACFPNLDGSLHLFVISPRHLEACATRTCQVLIEGTYSDALVADQHYLELKRDFSNLDQVLEIIKEDKFREKIVERAYQDVVESGKYTYRSFVKFILEQSLKAAEAIPSSTSAPSWSRLIYQLLRFTDKLSWFQVALHWYFILKVKIKLRQILVNIFSERVVVSTLRKIRQRSGD
jgi:hypothetical protein